MMSVGGFFKRLMELAVFMIGWQTSPTNLAAIWIALFLIYLLYWIWELYDQNIRDLIRKKDKEEL